MARIIHVDDKLEWIDLVRRALHGHQVDSATTYDEALRLINTAGPYDLALVDLNLVDQQDGMGCEILDLLQLSFPATRRVVITASPPAGDMRTTTFERYGLEGVIIKGKTTLPGLQSVVIRALRGDAGDIPQQVKVKESELADRYREWHDRLEEQLRVTVRGATDRLRHAGREGKTQSVADAKETLDRWATLQRQFAEDSRDLEGSVAAARTVSDVDAAEAALGEAMKKYSGSNLPRHT